MVHPGPGLGQDAPDDTILQDTVGTYWGHHSFLLRASEQLRKRRRDLSDSHMSSQARSRSSSIRRHVYGNELSGSEAWKSPSPLDTKL